MRSLLSSALLIALLSVAAVAADNLKLNPHLDYTSDSHDGPLITGDNLGAGFIAGTPAYVIIYGEGCYNSKHQARRTVSLYEKYKGRVQFIVIDLDHRLSSAQQQLKEKYYKGYIPHVVVLDGAGAALYNSSGEVEEEVISKTLDQALR